MLFAFAEALLIILLGERLRHYPRLAGPQRGQECLHGEAQAAHIEGGQRIPGVGRQR